MIIGTYDESHGPLLEDQWLLKLRDGNLYSSGKKYGFLTKLTQKGQIPLKFKDWGKVWDSKNSTWINNDTVYVWQETYRSGWILNDWRIGKSQEWAVLQHPEGFLLEVYLSNFLSVLKKDTADFGVLRGEYKWEDNNLIRKR